jgi:quinolinate synthase
MMILVPVCPVNRASPCFIRKSVLPSLEENRYVIELPPEILVRARRAVERMIEIGN